MRLLEKGIGVQQADWKVDQPQAAGYCRMYYMLGGRAVYTDDIQTTPLCTGRLYLFPAQRPYRIRHDPAAPIHCMWMHVDLYPSDVSRLVELDPALPGNETLRGLLTSLESESLANSGEELYRCLAQALALYLRRHPDIKNIDGMAAEVLSGIRGELFSPSLGVEQLSRRFGYSASHFIRMFRAWFGMTPHHYITVLRMSAAARHLADGTSVQETAALCGYTDAKSFARAFKKIYSVPPSAYVRFYRPRA